MTKILVLTVCLFSSCQSIKPTATELTLQQIEDSFVTELIAAELIPAKQGDSLHLDQLSQLGQDLMLEAFHYGYSTGSLHPIPRKFIGYWNGKTVELQRPTNSKDGSGYAVYSRWAAASSVPNAVSQRLLSRAIAEHILSAAPWVALETVSDGKDTSFSLDICLAQREAQYDSNRYYDASGRHIELIWTNSHLRKVIQSLPSIFSPSSDASSKKLFYQYEEYKDSVLNGDLFTLLRYEGKLDSKSRDAWEEVIVQALLDDWFGMQYFFDGCEFEWQEVTDSGEVELLLWLNHEHGPQRIALKWQRGQFTTLEYILSEETLADTAKNITPTDPIRADHFDALSSLFLAELIAQKKVPVVPLENFSIVVSARLKKGAVLLGSYSPLASSSNNSAPTSFVGYWDGNDIHCQAFDASTTTAVGGYPLYLDWVGDGKVENVTSRGLVSRAMLESMLYRDTATISFDSHHNESGDTYSRHFADSSAQGDLIELLWSNKLLRVYQGVTQAVDTDAMYAAEKQYVKQSLFAMFRQAGPLNFKPRTDWEQLAKVAFSTDWFGMQHYFEIDELEWKEHKDGETVTLTLWLNLGYGFERIEIVWLQDQFTGIYYYLE